MSQPLYNNCQLLLASRSPRRRQLLAQLGLEVKYVDLEVDERLTEEVPAREVAQRLAIRKSSGYLPALLPRQVLVTADTVVVCESEVLGKPADRAEAAEMLHLLSGCRHEVYTGVCLRTTHQQTSFSECTDVHFRHLTDDEINFYLDHYSYQDKAGAYGIQDWIGMIGVTRIEGCYYNVMGLPLARLFAELQPLIG